MNRQELIQALEQYKTIFSTEKLYIPRFLSIIQNFDACYSRSLTSGHLTASAFITDKQGKSILLTHHKKLNLWLQPGGHADEMENIKEVAYKEGIEETGLRSLALYKNNIFDIDIHQIPRHKKVQAHFHYDIRFLFTADTQEPLHISDESHALAWFKTAQIATITGKNTSILRMTEKLLHIFS